VGEIEQATAGPYVSGATGSSGIATLASSYAILRDPPVQPVPPWITDAYSGSAPEHTQYGIDPAQGRYAPATKTWILPGTSGICLIATGLVGPRTGSGACTTTPAALAGELVIRSTTTTGVVTLTGLAPDGNPSVTITDTDGTTRTAPVTDNVYTVTGGHPNTITLKDASGTTTTLPLNG
jgi:hypothetical protein